jgi:hypothetical protein
VSVVELTEAAHAGRDPTWCGRSRSASAARYEKIMLGTKVTKVEALPKA